MLAIKPFAWALPAPFPATALAEIVEIAPLVDAVPVDCPAGDVVLPLWLRPEPMPFPDEFPAAPVAVTV